MTRNVENDVTVIRGRRSPPCRLVTPDSLPREMVIHKYSDTVMILFRGNYSMPQGSFITVIDN
jgi:hypothetical protein